MADNLSLLVNGTIYTGWTELTAKRAIDRMVSTATLKLVQPPSDSVLAWQIDRWDPAVLMIGADVWLTGYVDEVLPHFDAQKHELSIELRSKTQDLFDCNPDIASGQFRGYTLEAIARSICGLFGVIVLVQADCSQVFPDATLQRGETAFTFLERLGRLAGVLLTDNGAGNLVLTTAGATRAAGTLVQGANMLSGSARLSCDKRFSQYIVKGQRALGSTNPALDDTGDDTAAIAPVATQLRAVALDDTVPRYRPHISIAEAQLDDAGMQRRANWECNYAIGRSTEATIGVQGYRQPDGSLWQTNQLVTVAAPYLHLEQDLLCAEITLQLSDRIGRLTEMRLGPVEGFSPDPGEVKLHTKKGKKGGGGTDWAGAGGS